MLATAADDRNIALYDIRADTPIRKVGISCDLFNESSEFVLLWNLAFTLLLRGGILSS